MTDTILRDIRLGTRCLAVLVLMAMLASYIDSCRLERKVEALQAELVELRKAKR